MLTMNRQLSTGRKRILVVLLCLMFIGSLLAGCGSNKDDSVKTYQQNNVGKAKPAEEDQGSSGERTITDELGHELRIPAEVTRVIAPNMEDSLVKLGVKPVAQWSSGQTGQPYLQEELKGIPKIDYTTGSMPSPELLMSYKPDLIILHTETLASNGAYEHYSKIAPTYVFKNASGNMEQSLTILGELLGKSSEAEQALQAYQEKVREAKKQLGPAAGDKKVAIIRFAPRGISLMGGKYLVGKVVHQDLGLGMSKLVENKNAANVSLEILLELDVDYIFLIDQYGRGTERMKKMIDNPVWKGMPAVKDGHVYEANTNYWLGSGLIAYEKVIDDIVRSITNTQ